jgi:hypothetical protein
LSERILSGTQVLLKVVGCRVFPGRPSRTVGVPGHGLKDPHWHLIERQPTQMAYPLLEWFCKKSKNSWSLNMSVLKAPADSTFLRSRP